MKRLFPFFALGLLTLFTACEEDDPVIENEEEVITQVTLTLFPSGTQEQVVFSFNDPDGDGGMAPELTQTGTLVAGADYRGQVSFANEDEGSIDGEIIEEGLEHQVFYETNTNLTFAYTDMDAAMQPIGLQTSLTTGAAGSGNLTITLKHEPEKAGAVISNPDAVGGETDVEVTFPITIQ